MNTIYLLLGSNEGDRINWLHLGIASIAQHCGVVIAQSGIYRTAAWGIEDQPEFLNQVLCVSTVLQPRELLTVIQDIELQLGRQRVVKWGQRTLDIDILFFNDTIHDEPDLKIPHPYMAARRFTLAPLAEIAPHKIHPLLGKSVLALLEACEDPLVAEKIP